MSSTDAFKFTVEDSPGGVVLRVSGEVDVLTAGDFARAIRTALKRGGTQATLIDLSAVVYFDSRGIHVLEEEASKTTTATLKLPRMIRRMLQILGIEGQFKILEP